MPLFTKKMSHALLILLFTSYLKEKTYKLLNEKTTQSFAPAERADFDFGCVPTFTATAENL